MNILTKLKSRFRPVLAKLVDDPSDLLQMIRSAQDSKFGDYQANFAMPLSKRLGKTPKDSPEVAAQVVNDVDVNDFCDPPEVAGPGFINLRLRDDWITSQLAEMLADDRLGIARVEEPKTYVVDYSSPNVAKPMHVGHIRSTVIGDALARTLRFLGHQVITDNHLGDWGTQFGMIIYGYKHFVDPSAYEESPVAELGRLYKFVNRLVDYHKAKQRIPILEAEIAQQEKTVADSKSQAEVGDKSAQKKARKDLRRLEEKLFESCADCNGLKSMIAQVEAEPELFAIAKQHSDIPDAVLKETAKLHAGDAENNKLWHDFLPNCRDEIQIVYKRLDIQFDHEHGESFYHDQLGAVVDDFESRGLAETSDGAICVFMDGFETPMLIRKQDGAFLYATTDLATIRYRMANWKPDAILYVVDHRQSEHFEKLFAAVRLWGYDQVELQHISFGTVLGNDGKPYKTRSGDTVGLEGLLDEAVARAHKVVSDNDEAKLDGGELSEEQRNRIANVVGHAAIKYADLSHNRTNDYVFSYDKMVALNGNTATYMQYSYARTRGIFERGKIDIEKVRSAGDSISIAEPAERELAVELLRFEQALHDAVEDFRPNQLTAYLFDLAKQFSKFFDQCHVLKAESDELRNSRLLLCDLTGRTIKQGLSLLGIDVIDKM